LAGHTNFLTDYESEILFSSSYPVLAVARIPVICT